LIAEHLKEDKFMERIRKTNHLHRKSEEQQRDHWNRLHTQLQRLLDGGWKITRDELAEGLGVSRQKLLSFLKTPNEGLQIQRPNILCLWDYLTDADELENRKKNAEVCNRRKTLRNKISTLDELLSSAGFLPTSQKGTFSSSLVERVQYRLTSPWIQDDAVLVHIIDNTIDTILDQGGFSKNNSLLNNLPKEWLETEEEIREWLSKNIKGSDEQTIANCLREIARFSNLGKKRFYEDELFELYQTIFENKNLKKSHIELTVDDCQFKTLTFSLIGIFDDIGFKNHLTEIASSSERQLRFSNFGTSEREAGSGSLLNQTNVFVNLEEGGSKEFPPVIETLVRIRLEDPEHPESKQEIMTQYAASTTHIEDMLTALSNGLGHILSNPMRVTSFFIRTIGKSLDSLVRISVSLTTDKAKLSKTYYGLWVEHNTIIGVLQAVLFAAMNWLSEHIGTQNLSAFFSVCQGYADLSQKVTSKIDTVYNHSHSYNTHSEGEDNRSVDIVLQECIEKSRKLIELLKELSDGTKSDNYILQEVTDNFYRNFQNHLLRVRFLAKLTRIHMELIQFNPENVIKKIDDLKQDLVSLESHSDHRIKFAPIYILYHSELMFWHLLSGEGRFIHDKEWRRPETIYSMNLALKNLQSYISQENNGLLDQDIYLAIAQFSAISSIVEFYACQASEAKYLIDAAERLLSAAHYAARIGQRPRASRLLCHASRVYCRTGEQSKAEQLIRAASKLLSDNRPDKQQASESLLELCRGEYLLRFGGSREEYYNALIHFVSAWCNAPESVTSNKKYSKNLTRTSIDSLYNIYRVLKKMQNKGLLNQLSPLREARGCLKDKEQPYREEAFEKFFREYSVDSLDSCEALQLLMKQAAIDAWNDYRLDGGNHPLAIKIQQDVFLEDVFPEKKN